MKFFRSRLVLGILGLGGILVAFLALSHARGYSIGGVSVSKARGPHLRYYYHK